MQFSSVGGMRMRLGLPENVEPVEIVRAAVLAGVGVLQGPRFIVFADQALLAFRLGSEGRQDGRVGDRRVREVVIL